MTSLWEVPQDSGLAQVNLFQPGAYVQVAIEKERKNGTKRKQKRIVMRPPHLSPRGLPLTQCPSPPPFPTLVSPTFPTWRDGRLGTCVL